MTKSGNDISYIASGFREDCVKLIEAFKNGESMKFESFCDIWKDMRFSLIFL